VPRITRMIIPDQESVYHVQTGNKGNFLSLGFGLKAFDVMNKKERLRKYRRYVYEAANLAEQIREELLLQGVSFCFETVFSHVSKIDFKSRNNLGLSSLRRVKPNCS
jgi:hypothetical protein